MSARIGLPCDFAEIMKRFRKPLGMGLVNHRSRGGTWAMAGESTPAGKFGQRALLPAAVGSPGAFRTRVAQQKEAAPCVLRDASGWQRTRWGLLSLRDQDEGVILATRDHDEGVILATRQRRNLSLTFWKPFLPTHRLSLILRS